jgi:hypothetical protein
MSQMKKQSKPTREKQPGTFPKGKSGNPGGRPKLAAEVRERAQSLTPAAIETLVDICRNSSNDSARVSAANALLDRGWGKPTQALEHSGLGGGPVQLQPGPLANFSDDELIQIERMARAMIDTAPDAPTPTRSA